MIKRRAALAMLAMVFGTGAAAHQALFGGEVGGALRGTAKSNGLWVLTYNVNFERISAATADVIAEADADIVFLQETHPEWEEELEHVVESRYPYSRFFHAADEGGLAILSRYRFEQVSYGSSSEGRFPAWCGLLHTPQGPVRVVHVHLQPPLDEEGSLLSGYFSTGESRRAELEAVLECFDAPDLIVGDFNEGQGPSIELVSSRGLHDAQDALGPVERTWEWETSFGDLTGTPDHIFASPQFEISAAQVIEAGASDHRALRAQLVTN